MIKLSTIIDQILEQEQNQDQVSAMDSAMRDGLSTLAANFNNDKVAMKREVEKTDLNINEALGVAGVIGILLALPKVTEFLGRGFRKLATVWKKLVKPDEAKGKESEFAKKIIEFSHKWHSLYIKGIKGMLKLIGAFDKAGIKSDKAQTQAAEAIYYTIIAGFAMYSGISAVGAFKSALTSVPQASDFSLVALESAMASIKSKEVAEFITKLGLKRS